MNPMNEDIAPLPVAGTQAIPVLGRWWNIGAALLGLATMLLWLAGYGPGATVCRALLLTTAAPPPPAAAPMPAAATPAIAAAVAVAAAAPATPEPESAAAPPAPASLPEPLAVLFAMGRATVPRETEAQLAPIVAFLKDNADAHAALAGFHDAKGDLTRNQQLALERSRAVRALLVAAGIAEDRIELRKPEETTGTGSDDQARRVEVSIER
jgi:outer membrane protein OmpA-like peptidoglycan-associated protein